MRGTFESLDPGYKNVKLARDDSFNAVSSDSVMRWLATKETKDMFGLTLWRFRFLRGFCNLFFLPPVCPLLL